MVDILKVTAGDSTEDLSALETLVRDQAPELLTRPGTLRSNGYLTEVILALGTAGAFKTVLEIVKAYFEREKARKIVITSRHGSFSIEAHDIGKLDDRMIKEAASKLLEH